MRNWKNITPKIITFGSLVGWIVTLLAFFGIDANTLRREVTAHILLLVLTLVFFALFMAGCFYWWKNSRITPENARQKIREWLDNLGYSYGVMTFPNLHWSLNVTSIYPNVLVARSKTHSDLLVFLTAFDPMTSEQRKVFESMSDLDKQKLQDQLALETAKSRIHF